MMDTLVTFVSVFGTSLLEGLFFEESPADGLCYSLQVSWRSSPGSGSRPGSGDRGFCSSSPAEGAGCVPRMVSPDCLPSVYACAQTGNLARYISRSS